jgi:hypothetical protein
LVSFRGFFEDYIFAWWNLRLVTELWYVEGFWFLLEGFLKIIFLHGEVLEFPWFFFCLKILLNVDGKATVWHTPCCFLCDISCRRWASVFGFLVCEPFDSKWSFSRASATFCLEIIVLPTQTEHEISIGLLSASRTLKEHPPFFCKSSVCLDYCTVFWLFALYSTMDG